MMMSGGVFAKLVVLVIGVGGSAVGVLALRQSRLQAAHEAAEARLRMRSHTERTMELRADIARRVTPEALAEFANDPQLIPAIEARQGLFETIGMDSDHAGAAGAGYTGADRP